MIDLKKLSIEYDRFYEEADKLFKKYNPCKFKDGKCICNRNNTYPSKNGCCGMCRYLNSKGCTIKSLGCKLYICWREHGKILDERRALIKKVRRVIPHPFSPLNCYISKEEYLAKVQETIKGDNL